MGSERVIDRSGCPAINGGPAAVPQRSSGAAISLQDNLIRNHAAQPD
jgi:hypothetical protein